MLGNAIPPLGARQALPKARPVQPKVLADKGIGPEFEFKQEEEKKQYAYLLEEK